MSGRPDAAQRDAAHPEVLWENNHLISADYVGHVMNAVEEKLGGVGSASASIRTT